ncbi:MAG: helix-turn-helix transcriptional regulator [Alphaproteobacteria bacterium]|nr:helix-turn-helix transcriptional regulator [Alphaproteobacteria bacterium]MBT5389802.1 helix-turn-helix transcriptional regulator [Alphaproteobacteria bacterium]MBT5540128.1 helix-turn-helix transcriptional regulator [Alphaproteobacteria bacterium]MBT5654024.1 helix-turn-helix transcriptional regulator [Alphaproteobacteria bacterium]
MYLTNNTQWLEDYFENNFLNNQDHNNKLALRFHSRDRVSSDELPIAALFSKYDLLLRTSVVEEVDEYFEAYSFAGSSHLQNKYIFKEDIMKKFVKYFKFNARKLINVCDSKKLFFSDFQFPTFNEQYSGQEKNFLKEIEIPHHHVFGENGDTFLSPREKQCMDLICEGMTSCEIAKILNLSSRTIESYVSNIKDKLLYPKRLTKGKSEKFAIRTRLVHLYTKSES